MASNNRSDKPLPGNVLASCDDSGVTIINEDACFSFEDGPVEVAYINIDEDMMLAELVNDQEVLSCDEDTRSSRISSRLSSRRSSFVELDYPEDNGDSDSDVRTCTPKELEDQVEIFNNFCEGKLSFKEFLTTVESGEESEDKENEILADSGKEEENEDETVDSDPDYTPMECGYPGPSKSNTAKTFRATKQNKVVDSHISTPGLQKQSSSKAPKTRGRKHGQKIVKRLPPALQGLMGEANLRCARGETDDAIKLCMEVIRQAPTFAEPFQTLSMLYEISGDYEKSYQLALIAAHLSPQDADEWLRLAEICLCRGDDVQAAKCFAKAAVADISNLKIHQRRCELLESMGAHNELLQACLTMLRGVQPDTEDGLEWIKLAEHIACIHYGQGNFSSARRALSNALFKCSAYFTMENYHLLLELHIITKHYIGVIKVLNNHLGVVFDRPIVDDLDIEDATTMELTKTLPLDILSKLCLALIQLKKLKMALPVIATLFDSDVEDYGDIFLDIAEAMAENDYHHNALTLFEKLVHSQKFSMAGVWLKYADSLVAVDRIDDSIAAYRHVIKLAPAHEEARLRLAELLQKLGRSEEALEAVTQDWDSGRFEASVVHQRCLLLLKEERMDEFIRSYKLLMSRHTKNIRTQDDVHKACGAKRIGWDSDDESDEEPEFGSSNIEVEEEYRLLRLAADYLYKEKRLVELQRMCFMALTSRVFRKKQEIHRECRFLALQVCMAKGDSFFAYNLARALLLSNLHNNRVWNLFIQVIMRGDDLRHNRFLMRLLMKHPDHICISVLNGHACLAAGTYKYSLNEYMSACKIEPNNPLMLLLNAVVLVQMTCQKFSSSKHSLVKQASTFFDAYLRCRGDCQETFYNIGRAMHQLGLLQAAIEYYVKALECQPSVTRSEHVGIFDLSREIAYNLSLAYRSSGKPDKARKYLYKYIRI